MKSHASIFLEVAEKVLRDVFGRCTAAKFDLRDLLTLRSRTEHEGLSFLTMTLPDLGKDFEKSLARGQVDPSDFPAFRKAGRTPAFLQGIFGLVFAQTTGVLLDEPSIEAIEGIRQIAYLFKKLEADCSPVRVAAAIGDYRQCEYDLDAALDPRDEDTFLRLCQCIWPRVLDPIDLDQVRPKHGPGATQERVSGNRKYVIRRWHERLEPYFPLLDVAYSCRAAFSKEVREVTFVSENDESPVRVITVPKTLKGPRIIAVEPVCMQYTQQALSRSLMKAIEHARLTAGHINFSDQSVNRSIALESSRTGEFATLDLSSASDRVPLSLAVRMFDSRPDLKGAVQACRSTRAKLPSGDVISLKKFASMGSALCFPVESMYFYTLCVGALLEERKLPVTPRNVRKVAKVVYVYGDDIIVPTDSAVAVSDYLTKYYCKVNAKKSFWTGKFRESCGMDAYAGEEVTPVYVRSAPPESRRSASAIVSWVETSNLLFRKGYWLTADYMKNHVEGIIGTLPVIGDRCPGLGWLSSCKGYPDARVRGRYQRPEVRTWVPSPSYRPDTLEGWSALTKCLLMLESRSPSELVVLGDHLSKTARYHAVTLKRGWVPPA